MAKPGPKHGLSREQHETIAETLRRMNLEFRSFHITVLNSYPLKSRPVRAVDKVQKALQELKFALESASYSDQRYWPDSIGFDGVKNYFGQSD